MADASVKDIVMKVIPSSIANPFIKAHHYSGKVVQNSCLHFGAFLGGHLHGVLSYGPSLDKSKIIGLVRGTGWNEFLELNRMAFDDKLPRCSESRCIAISLRMIKKNAPQIKWVISFADGCSCGDGTIYRASNFVLTDIKVNRDLWLTPQGEKIHSLTIKSAPDAPRPELGGGKLQSNWRELFYLEEVEWSEKPCRLSATIYLLSRPDGTRTTNCADSFVLAHRRTRSRNVSRQKNNPRREARGWSAGVGIEPTYHPWNGCVLTLNDLRVRF